MDGSAVCMTDRRVEFLQHALSGVPGYQLLSEENPLTFQTAQGRYSVHISSIHDSGAGRPNDDEERIQVPRSVIDIQRARLAEGYTPLFIGFFPDGAVFTAWEPDHVFSQNPKRYGTVYARYSHNQLAREQGVATRTFSARNLGRRSTTISAPAKTLQNYISTSGNIHVIDNNAGASSMLYG